MLRVPFAQDCRLQMPRDAGTFIVGGEVVESEIDPVVSLSGHTAHLAVRIGTASVFSSRSRRRFAIACRARLKRERTVPSGVPRIAATSAYDRPWMAQRTITSR